VVDGSVKHAVGRANFCLASPLGEILSRPYYKRLAMWSTEIRIMIREVSTGKEVPANPRNSFIENGFVHSLYCGYLAVIRLESEESPTSVIDERESTSPNNRMAQGLKPHSQSGTSPC
jgi:hypothetical protein